MNVSRRNFFTGATALAASTMVGPALAGWKDRPVFKVFRIPLGKNDGAGLSTTIDFNRDLWETAFREAKSFGYTHALIELGEAVQYKSHPELAAKDAVTTEWLKKELVRIRSLGIEPLPMLNFSATHNGWLGPHRYTICSKRYYRVCRELIHEVADLFGHPAYFHIGMNDEDYDHQLSQPGRGCVYYRRNKQFWHDVAYYQTHIEDCGGRAWMWGDYGWLNGEDFEKSCPRDVTVSNCYYNPDNAGYDAKAIEAAASSRDKNAQKKAKYVANGLRFFDALERRGLRQFPCGTLDTMKKVAEIGQKAARGRRLEGFLVNPLADWRDASKLDEFKATLATLKDIGSFVKDA